MDSWRFTHRNRRQRDGRRFDFAWGEVIHEREETRMEREPPMNFKFGWSRRSFLAALGAVTGGLFAPSELDAASIFGKKHKPPMPSVDGSPIVPITTGL